MRLITVIIWLLKLVMKKYFRQSQCVIFKIAPTKELVEKEKFSLAKQRQIHSRRSGSVWNVVDKG